MLRLKLLFISCTVLFISHGQTPTVGLVHSGYAQEGYTLFTTEGTMEAHLIDNCGRLINKWDLNDTPGLSCYLLENGNLLFAGSNSIELRDWDNNLLWSYQTTSNGINQHHDIEPMPNGNVLLVVRDNRTQAELWAAGRDTTLAYNNFRMDKIIELEPVGTSDANIVWEWKFWDHLIQDFDPTKPNFGVVADNPHRVDLNFIENLTTSNLNDWSHVNSVDYNADLDQIMISGRQMSELYIIDHSTTTAEAATSSGGNSGKGGDILWRWGNPRSYDQGTESDQLLFGQHDGQWIKSGYQDEGKIGVFNNGGDGSYTYSSVHIIDPGLIGYNYSMTNNTFDPSGYDFTWNGDNVSPVVSSNKKCGAMALPNGGFMICFSTAGRFLEINGFGELVWEYTNPVTPSGITAQYATPPWQANAAFRAEKYPADYPGIPGSITPGNILEDVNLLSDTCSMNIGIEELEATFTIVNPIRNGLLEVQYNGEPTELVLSNSNGELLTHWTIHEEIQAFDVSKISSGIYFLQLLSEHSNIPLRKKVIVLD